MFLNYKEAFQVLDKFATTSDPALRRKFTPLALKVYRMVRNGWQGIELEENFLETVKTVTLRGNVQAGLQRIIETDNPEQITALILDGGTVEVKYLPRLQA